MVARCSGIVRKAGQACGAGYRVDAVAPAYERMGGPLARGLVAGGASGASDGRIPAALARLPGTPSHPSTVPFARWAIPSQCRFAIFCASQSRGQGPLSVGRTHSVAAFGLREPYSP
jgi:hypothetical protein